MWSQRVRHDLATKQPPYVLILFWIPTWGTLTERGKTNTIYKQQIINVPFVFAPIFHPGVKQGELEEGIILHIME